ncbi:protein kinase domain-containing protein [Ferrovibrio sp.]|uniref:protein kinase domain-containing protein n=1 Tax=Ferrovibrio sp. TaxID=1917215 RepID=UPI003D127BBD
MVTVESIRAKIARMGQVYQPGNASRPGHLYNPLPFDDFADIPYQRDAVEERFALMQTTLPRPFKTGRLLDIGCHSGYNCFRFQRLGYTCTGIEKDTLTCEIGQDVNELKQTGITFINAAASPELIRDLGHFDVILFLSTFQWVVHFDGFEAAVKLLTEVQRHCDVLFFETSMGQEGKMKLPQIPDAAAVHAMVKNTGIHSHVDCLGAIPAPGSPMAQKRLLFRSQNRAVAAPDLWAMAPEGLAEVARMAANSKPFYAKENDQFISRIYGVLMSGTQKLAVKMVQAKNDTARSLLYREHEFLYSLDAPCFVKPATFGMDEKTYVLAMPLLEGKTLAQAAADGMIENKDAVRAGLQQAQTALKAAGIRHRDLRPQNVMLTAQGPVILDFGWACWEDEGNCPAPPQLAVPDDDAAFAALFKLLD